MIIIQEECVDRTTNRRAFPRIPYRQPLFYWSCQPKLSTKRREGWCENVSPGGILFSTAIAPPLTSIIMIETDIYSLGWCIMVDDALLCIDNRLLGKVVRIIKHKHEDMYNVGICFIRSEEEHREDVQHIFSLFYTDEMCA